MARTISKDTLEQKSASSKQQSARTDSTRSYEDILRYIKGETSEDEG